VSPVLEGESGDVGTAQKTLEERLLIELSTAYTVDTLVQFPVSVTSPFSDPSTAPRLAGKPQGAPYVLPAQTTPSQVAEHFLASIALVATLIADVTGILQPGFVVRIDDKPPYTVLPTDTVTRVAHALGIGPVALLTALKETPGFFGALAVLNLVRRQYVLRDFDTLATAIGRLAIGTLGDQTPDSALFNFAVMNAKVPSLFKSGKELEIDSKKYTTREGDDLVTIARALDVKVLDVVEAELDTEDLVQPGSEISLLILVPGFSLSDAKIPLVQQDDERSSLTFLFQTNSELSHLTLDIAYQVQELEYAIADVSWARGYQTSSWLSFVLPVRDQSPGRIEIPIPLRAYPLPPVVTGQRMEQSLPADPRLEQIKSYDYLYDFNYRAAPQDTLLTSYEVNIPDRDSNPRLAIGPTLPQTLAQYAAVATALDADLALLTIPGALEGPGLREYAGNAVEIFSRLAEQIAGTWKTWAPPNAVERSDRPLYGLRRRHGRDGRSRLRVQAANALAEAQAMPEIRLKGSSVEAESRGRGFTAQTLAAPAAVAVDFVDDVYQVRVPGLDVIGTQNIWGNVAVKRNDDLIPGHQTRSEFVYQLNDVRFTSKFVPLIRSPRALDVTSLPPYTGEPESPKLLKYVIRLFANLLLSGGSPKPQARNIRLAASFGFVLAEEPPALRQEIETRVPVLLRPVFLFDPSRDLSPTGGFCFELASQLTAWHGYHQAETARGARWIFDISVYSTFPSADGRGGASQPPLLELKTLYLDFEDLKSRKPT
ncbi:MAG: hypothetical protein AAFY88_09490, partial [Acidobacteriota bacterium]